VFLQRNGQIVPHGDDEVEIPKFGGGDRAWGSIVTCVKQQFSPFQIDIVDRRPSHGEFITAVVGGLASQVGLDDRSTNGVGPYDGHVIPNAVVHVFSKVGTGERDTDNLCAVTVHEVSHALGLDHTYRCGDVMSYFLDRCGPRRFLDAEVPCGEGAPRTCGDGEDTQNSYRRVAAAVGLRKSQPEPEPELWPEPDPELEPELDPEAAAPEVTYDPWADQDADDPGTEPCDAAPAPPPQAQAQAQRPSSRRFGVQRYGIRHGHRRVGRRDVVIWWR